MPVRSSIGAVVLATVIVTTIAAARAHDETKYPDWLGQWKRPAGVGNQWDAGSRPR
jgi:succinate dehydrogenase hydrophobic anchor subunit